MNENKLAQYIHSRGLKPALVSQQMKITRQALGQYGKNRTPTASTLAKMARAMTELGAPTTAVDLVPLFDK